MASSADEGHAASWADQAVAERVADAMYALSTPSRVQILGCLTDGPKSVGDLVEALGMEQSAVSHQLRVLREHRLVIAERAGRRRVYALADEHVISLLTAALHHVQGNVTSNVGSAGRRSAGMSS